MRKNFYILIIALSIICSSAFAQVNVLYMSPTVLGSDPVGAQTNDSVVVEAIRAAGDGSHFNVTVMDYETILDNVDAINSYDVVVVGRGCGSSVVANSKGEYPDESAAFLALTAPVIHTSPWVMRGDRLGLLTAGCEHQNTDDAKIVYGNVTDPSHAIFNGVTLDGDSISWTEGYTSNMQPEEEDITGGTVLAKTFDNRGLVVVYPSGATLNNGRVLAGPRAYMGNGQDNVSPVNYWNFTESGAGIFFNLLDFMAEQATAVSDYKIDEVPVLSVEGGIKVKAGADVTVYSLDGKVVEAGISDGKVECASGIYVVNVDGLVAKVIVK